MRNWYFVCFLLVGCVPYESQEPFHPDRYLQAMELVDKGTQLLRSKRFQQAAATFSVAVDIMPLPEAYDGIGCAWLELGDLQGAEKMFWTAFRQNPDYWYSLGNLALLYERVGERRAARDLLREVVRNLPGDYQVRNNLGVLTVGNDDGMSGSGGEALEHFRKAIALRDHPQVLRNRDILLSGAGKRNGINKAQEK